MTTATDKLILLKRKYVDEISAREKELVALRAKLSVIEELETESESLNGSSTNGTVASRYASMGLTDAALDAVNAIAITSPVSTSKIKKHLLSNGFRPGGKNFIVSLGTTLKRLAKSNRIRTVATEEGTRLYQASEYK